MKKVFLKNQLTEYELKEKMMKCETRQEFQRWQAIYLLQKGDNPNKVAETTLISLGTVYQWIFQYNRNGVSGYELQGRGGRRYGLLTLDEEKEILNQVSANAKEGKIIGAFSIRQTVEKKIGRVVAKDYIYDLFHRHGWRKVIPRPIHPKSNIETQQDFKKNFRSFWMPLRKPTKYQKTNQ